jgi:hypothetical protein
MLQSIWHAVSGGMLSWYEAKMFIEHASLVSSDALHVIVGVLVWMLFALLLRVSLADWRPWLVLLVLLVLNEMVDLWVERWPDPAMQYGESAKDLLLTMTLPTLLLLVVRVRPGLFSPSPRLRRGSGGRSRRS